MKAYLSYTSNGYQKKPNQTIIDLHKVCFFHLKKHFSEIYFITDSESKSFFQNIPWTNISTELDSMPLDYPEVWSLSKILVYEMIAKKGDPFIHVDNDVILWKNLPERILKSDVFVQSPEVVEKHKYEINKFIKNCPDKSIFKFINYPDISYNMGVFGGNDLKFILDYSTAAKNFVLSEENAFFWKNFDGYKEYWCKAVLAEQYFLSGFSLYKNKKIDSIFPEWPSEEMCVNTGYTHLMQVKSHPDMQTKIKLTAENITFNNL